MWDRFGFRASKRGRLGTVLRKAEYRAAWRSWCRISINTLIFRPSIHVRTDLDQNQAYASAPDWCYIETHDKNYIGHFHLRCVEFTPQNLSIEFDRPADNLVSVTFAMAASDFEEASRVVTIISGEIELP